VVSGIDWSINRKVKELHSLRSELPEGASPLLYS